MRESPREMPDMFDTSLKEDIRMKCVKGSYTRSGNTFRPNSKTHGDGFIWVRHYTANSRNQAKPLRYCAGCNSHTCFEGDGGKHVTERARSAINRGLRMEIKHID